jgi:serum/glucocorticoid-regulated kinase 2
MNQRSVTYSFCGSTEYMPPEMILREGHSYGVDFYTLGALLYELVTGLPPFYSRNEEEIKNAIVN